jgi:lysophospholipase L1-like esterase
VNQRIVPALLFCASLVVGLLLTEGALRLYDAAKEWRAVQVMPPLAERAVIPSDDPELIFEWNPGWHRDGFSVNSFGMPNAEIALAPNGHRRIAIAGDSISAHFELIPLADVYVSELGRLLEPEGYEVLNFGVGGYSLLQTARMLESHALRFAPDILIAQLCLNDPYPTPGPYTPEQSAHGPGLRLTEHVLNQLMPDRYWARRLVVLNYDEQGVANVRRGFTRLAEISQASGVPAVAVLFPYLYARAYEEWNFASYHRVFHEAAEASGVPLLDLYEAFHAAGLIGAAPFPTDRIHPDRKGHALAAGEIARELHARGMLQAAHRLEFPTHPKHHGDA